MSLCDNCEGHTHTYCSTAPCGLMTCKGFRHKHYKLNPIVSRRCCDCANQGTKLRYQCKHSGELTPIECESFIDARFKECLYCKFGHEFKKSIFCLCDSEKLLWDTPEMLLDIKCSCFEPKKQKTDSWISIKDRLPSIGAHIKVKLKTGYELSGRLTKLHTFIDSKNQSATGNFDDIGVQGFSIVYWQPILAEPEKSCNTCDTRSYPRKGFCIHVNKCIQNNYSCWMPKLEKSKRTNCIGCTHYIIKPVYNMCGLYGHFHNDCTEYERSIWINVKDRLPERYELVRANTKDGNHVVYWDAKGWWIVGTGRKTEVYSWQPLNRKLGFYADDQWLHFDDGQDIQDCIRVDDTTVNRIVNWLNAIWVSTGRH